MAGGARQPAIVPRLVDVGEGEEELAGRLEVRLVRQLQLLRIKGKNYEIPGGLGSRGEKAHIRALVCAPQLLCALVCVLLCGSYTPLYPTPLTPSSLTWVPQSRLTFGHHCIVS